MNELKVVTFNFDNNPEGHKLSESCIKFGYDLEVIGQGAGFKNFRQAKLDLLLTELDKIKSKYVMFTDGLDSWFLRPDIFKVYKDFQRNVVVSGNRDNYPATDLYEDYPTAKTSFRYICSSQFIGRTDQVIKTLSIIRDNYEGNTDQEGWNYCYAKGLIKVAVDHECRLFLNMTNVLPEELTKDLRLTETKKKPCSIHFGGPKGADQNAVNMQLVWRRSGI